MPSAHFAVGKFAVRKIILARHGRTDWNDIHKFQGSTDIPLNADGIAQAEKTAARLADWPADAVYASPLSRAGQTAELIAARHGKTPIVLPELTEIYFGSWEGLSFRDSLKKKDEALLRWIADPFFNAPSGAEEWESIKRRTQRAVNLVLESGYENVVIVSHGGIMRGLLAVFLGFDPHTVWKIKASNCSLTGIEVKEHETSLVFVNDTAHLKQINEGPLPPLW